MINKKFLAGVALALGLSSNANAAITIFTDQASFLAAISAPATDTFQDLSIAGATAAPITRTAGAYGYTASVSTTSFYGAGTSADHWLSTNTATDVVSFGDFTGGVFGVGANFFASNINGAFAPGGVVLTATDADGTVSRTISNATQSSFLGFVSTSGMTGMTLAAIQPNTYFLWPTADNLTLGGAGCLRSPRARDLGHDDHRLRRGGLDGSDLAPPERIRRGVSPSILNRHLARSLHRGRASCFGGSPISSSRRPTSSQAT